MVLGATTVALHDRARGIAGFSRSPLAANQGVGKHTRVRVANGEPHAFSLAFRSSLALDAPRSPRRAAWEAPTTREPLAEVAEPRLGQDVVVSEAFVGGPRQVAEVCLAFLGRLIGFVFGVGVVVTVAVVIVALIGPTVGASHPPTVVKV